MSIEEAKRVAFDRAKIQAIADEFGTTVSQSNSTIISNDNGQSNTQFFSFGGSDVKGEWIETIGEPKYDVSFTEHYLVVICNVTGKIREQIESKIDLTVATLRNGTELKYAATEFKNGDDMFLFFESPIDGYLSVFLIDKNANSVFMILPYSKSGEGSVSIKKDTPYIFFSKKCAPELERAKVVEYTLTSDEGVEYNDIVCVFSPKNHYKPKTKSENNSIQPPSLGYESFMKWIHSIQKDSHNQVETIQIKISKE